MEDLGVLSKYIGLGSLGIAVFGISYGYNKKFLDWLRFQSIGTRDYVADRLNLMFVEIPPNQILLAQFALSFGLGGITFLSFLPQVFPGLLFGSIVTVLGWKAPKPIVNYLYNKRVDTFTVQMIDALGLMSNGMKSGLSIVQSLGLVVNEMPDPIRQEFNLILSQNKLGVPLEECFVNLSKRIESDDVEMFVTSVNILKETGGNLAETFDTIVSTMRERIKVEGKIKALTAQGFNQGMFLLAVPPILAVLIYQTDPNFMRPMFTSIFGWAMVAVIILFEIVGFFAIMRLTKIDV